MSRKPVPEHNSALKLLKGAKHCSKMYDSTFIIFLIALTEIEIQNLSLRDILNLRSVC